jgi:ABC-2 type transport system permease protein
MTAATSRAGSAVPRGAAPGFAATLASEWTKMTTVRSTYITVGLGVLVSIASTALVSAVVGATFDDWAPADQSSFDPVLFGFFGAVFTSILFAVYGVSVVASEYSSNMMRLTLTATPRRGRVLAAKLALVTLVVLVAGTIASLGMFLVAQAVFSIYDMPTASLGDSDAVRAVLGIGLLGPVFPVIGATLAFMFRSTAAPITSVMALIFAPSIFGPLFPRSWQENVLAYLPGPASDSVAIGHLDEDSAMILDPALALIVVIVWMVLFTGAAWLALTRRDA